MNQSHRIEGGLVDRSRTLKFSFDQQQLAGYPGDTLASALIANGIHLMGRSFKYHRPRGPLSAGSEEPNALVSIGAGDRLEPNSRATTVELQDGLTAQSQNRFPSLGFDVLALNDVLSPLLTAGFYYKTFMWPASFWERVYEPLIRRAAGLGKLSGAPDPDVYDKGFLHCDVLVIGAGPSGLMAALAAGRAGARVILVDEDFRRGGRLLAERYDIDDMPGAHWAEKISQELASLDNVRVMSRTTVFGVFDHGTYGALERVFDHRPDRPASLPRQTLWRIYARRSVLAAGAVERTIAFTDNDRPGIMLAGAVRTYANRFAALCGKRLAVFTNNDDGWRTAVDLAAAGAEVQAVIDTRASTQAPAHIDGSGGLRHIAGGTIVGTKGRLGLRALLLGDSERLEVDCLAVSGGWNPVLHLTCHHRSHPRWHGELATFIPGHDLPPGMMVAGSANGTFSTSACLAEGCRAGTRCAEDLGFQTRPVTLPEAEDSRFTITPFWRVKSAAGRAWLDFQNDVTTKDLALAVQEGFRSPEHAKRYTTLGMATDQGKTANITALAIIAELRGRPIAEIGTTTYRPPYTPVTIGAFAGRSRGKAFRPFRLAPSHRWAEEQGAVFVEAGLWLRAQWFPRAGETHWRQSVDREVLSVRNAVGVCDVSTLGKIDVQGADALDFLERVYANGLSTLNVGRCRYGVMLRDDGFVMDDGTIARLDDQHFIVTTTTANAGSVFRHLQFCHQCLWPDLDVQLTSVTEQWAQYAIAGPSARKLLETVVDPGFDLSNDALPFMAYAEVTICGGLPARLFRLSFSGELAFELAVPVSYGDGLIRVLIDRGRVLDVAAYGTEALNVLRIEKGHPTGNELNGQTTARDLGMGRMVSRKKHFIGEVAAGRPGLNVDEGLRLAGFKPVDSGQTLTAGAHFLALGVPAAIDHDEGYLTSVAFSPNLGHSIGLGLLRRGAERLGERIRAVDLVRGHDIEVEVCSPHFIDPEGERLRG